MNARAEFPAREPMGVGFYPAHVHDTLNTEPLRIYEVTGTAMVNPFYPSVSIAGDPLLVCDSQAFQHDDTTPRRARLSATDAIEAQLRLRDRLARPFEAVVTYDQVLGVDEKIERGRKVKARGTVETARTAVEVTVRSAEAYAERAGGLGCAVAFAAQGVEPPQYEDCVRRVLQFARVGVDWLALGGWCILGRQKGLLPKFIATLRRVLPHAAAHGVERVHLLGVCWHVALGVFAEECQAHGLRGQADSSSIEQNSVRGRVWHVDNMREGRLSDWGTGPIGSPWKHAFGPTAKGAGYRPAILTCENLTRFAEWAGGGCFLPRSVNAEPRPAQAAFPWWQEGAYG